MNAFNALWPYISVPLVAVLLVWLVYLVVDLWRDEE